MHPSRKAAYLIAGLVVINLSVYVLTLNGRYISLIQLAFVLGGNFVALFVAQLMEIHGHDQELAKAHQTCNN